jgi:hypothetical protein
MRSYRQAFTGRCASDKARSKRPENFFFQSQRSVAGLGAGGCFGVARYAFTVTDLHRLPSAGLPAHPSTHEAAYLEFTRISPV